MGAGGVREMVVGNDDRPATPAELREMEKAVAQAMEEGALGLSTSLIYTPGRFASTEEIIALAKVAARYGGIYITHQRSEEEEIDQSLDEVFRIARETPIPTEIYHLKTAGRAQWGRMPAVLKRIEQARAEGLDITADQYPYAASSNNLSASLPIWVREGGRDKMLARLRDPQARAKARADFLAEDPPLGRRRTVAHPDHERAEPGAAPATKARPSRRSRRRKARIPYDALMDLVLADRGNTGRVTFSMSEDDVRDGAQAPARLLLHGLRRARDRRAAVARQVAPARLGLGHAHPRQVRARGEAAAARGGDPQDDVAARPRACGLADRGCCGRAWRRTWWRSTR